MQSDIEKIDTWGGLRDRHGDPARGRVACGLEGEVFPFAWEPPDPLALLDEARRHPKVRILRQSPGDTFDPKADASEVIRALPLEKAAREPHLHLSIFDLSDLCQPGRVLHGLSEAVFKPFERLCAERGVRWEGGFWPILFIGGSASATNYHIDPTPNAIFHLFGEKRFHSLKEPDRWCPQEVKDAYLNDKKMAVRPPGVREEDCLIHDNAPGDLVWIPQLSPHWVNAGSFSATVTFAFRQFRFA